MFFQSKLGHLNAESEASQPMA